MNSLDLDFITAQYKEKQAKLLVNDIIDIYDGLYENYDDYVKNKKAELQRIYELEKENTIFKPNGNVKIVQYVKPIIIEEFLFNYIQRKW